MPTLPAQTTYNNGFGILRFLLASLVVWNHSFYFTGVPDEQFIPSRVGNESAMFFRLAVFFVISGYLVTASLNSQPGYLHFMWKRFLRLWPGLIAAILGAALVLGPLLTTLPLADYFTNPVFFKYLCGVSLVKLHYYLPGVFTANKYALVNASLWSLQYELIFYFILLGLHIIGIWTKPLYLALLIISGWLLMGWLYYNPLAGPVGLVQMEHVVLGITINHRIFLHFLLFFMAGGWLAVTKVKAVKHWVALLAFIPLAATLNTPYFSWVLNAGLPALVIYICTRPAWFRFYHGTAPLGNISYGLFIYAFPIQQVVIQFFSHSFSVPLQFVLSYTLTLAIATLSWHFIEKPALRFKDVFADKTL